MFSELINGTVLANSSNYARGRSRNGVTYKVCKITPHQMAGKLTAKRCGELFQNPSRNASSNYGIGYDGQIYGYVPEEDRAWTSSSWRNDIQAITIECSNAANGTSEMTEATWNSLIKLCVDICTRYNFRLTYDGTANGSLTRHNMFANTACPGDWLQSRLPELARIVNEKLDGNPGGSDEPVRIYKNGSTREDVFSDTNLSNKIGSLDPWEQCDCFGIFNDRPMVRYRVNGKNVYKIGFCKWKGGVK